MKTVINETVIIGMYNGRLSIISSFISMKGLHFVCYESTRKRINNLGMRIIVPGNIMKPGTMILLQESRISISMFVLI